jgi:acyl dehydratase
MTRYYEDFEIGHVAESLGKTVTESDLVLFAGLSGDHHALHTDEEFARRSRFGQRIAHGALILSIATGLFVQMDGPNPALIAYYGIDKLRFVQPVFIGDMVRVRVRVVGKSLKDDIGGLVTFEKTVLNQDDQTVLSYVDKMLFQMAQ